MRWEWKRTDGGAGTVLIFADLDTALEFGESVANRSTGTGYKYNGEEEQRPAQAVPENHRVAGGGGGAGVL